MTVFERFAKWAEGFFNRDKLNVLAEDIDHLIDAADNNLDKLKAFLATVQSAVRKVEGLVATSEGAAAEANVQVAALESGKDSTAA